MNVIDSLAQGFGDLFYNGNFSGDRSFDMQSLSLGQAYQVQERVAAARLARGERAVGYKVGCTSRAIQEQFNLREPIFGRLFKPHVLPSGAVLHWDRYTGCAIEPEMVIKMGRDLAGGDMSLEQVRDAIEHVSPGIEVHNFKFWFDPVTSQELIASNGIHACLVKGSDKALPEELDFKSETFQVFIKGALAAQGTAEQIMGGPLHSIRWLAVCLANRGQVLKKGEYVIPGSPVELLRIAQDSQVRVAIQGVGSVEAKFLSARR